MAAGTSVPYFASRSWIRNLGAAPNGNASRNCWMIQALVGCFVRLKCRTGSLMDGEDVVHEALIEAYRKLDQFDDSRPLKPWLFRIAHNRCIDFLRRKGVRDKAEAATAVPEGVLPAEPAVLALGTAVERLVISLPPKERACVLLKDVFDYSLEEIAALVDTTVGGVKAALSRGRMKLASSPAPSQPARSANPELQRIMQLYVDHFNRRDTRDSTSSVIPQD